MKHLLIVGLGNPGDAYNRTRHNIGFMAIDAIASYFDFPKFVAKFSSLISSKAIKEYKITLLKPQTFMNLSGSAIAKALNFYKIPQEDLIIIHDDLDLQVAKVKMKLAGGSAGHNGIKSIDLHLGLDYYRIRLGIGKPSNHQDISSFVLSKFTASEEKEIELLMQKLVEAFGFITAKDLPAFMNIMAMENKNGL